jgi:hypothetical protein
VNPEVLVEIPPNFFHLASVTCLATKEWVDLMLGKGPAAGAWKEKGNHKVKLELKFR